MPSRRRRRNPKPIQASYPRHTRDLVNMLKEQIGQPILGCEVGAYRGHNSRRLTEFFPQLKMLIADHWRPMEDSEHQDTVGLMAHLPAFDMASAMLEVHGIPEDRRVMAVGSSTMSCNFIKDHIFDFVFIDACHTYRATSADIKSWNSKVMNDGILCGHDYGNACDRRLDSYGVKRSVDEFVEANNLQLTVMPSSVWWVRLPPTPS